MLRVIAVVVASALTTAAFAADPVGSVGQANGKVMVSHGDQFVEVKAGDAIMAGERLMVADGGSATVQFKDGCSLPVAGNTIVTLPAASTCAGGQAIAQSLNPSRSAAVGTGGLPPGFWTFTAVFIPTVVWAVSENENQKKSP